MRAVAGISAHARRSVLVLAIGVMWMHAAVAHGVPTGADGRLLRTVDSLIARLRLEEAERSLADLETRHPADSDVLYLRALTSFHRGQYARAVEAADAALRAGTASDERRAMRQIMADTRDATAGFVSTRSADGRYVVLHEPGRDAVLVPYALETLRTADQTIVRELGVRVPGPIRLEVYPTAASLARVSTLSVEDIERTGTIALCKWDRLMITSPRSLVRGYPWLDTISHELVHLILARGTEDKAPVWLQEGVAKFLEQRWRRRDGGPVVDPASQALLVRALRGNTLLPFERLHPSIARLPSQEDAALAFAQVATFVASFHRAKGAAGLASLVQRVAHGDDAREALAAVEGQAFRQIEARWRTELGALPEPDAAPPRLLSMRLHAAGGTPDESLDVTEETARRHLRLGDLLWDRSRPRAAAIEYEKARVHAIDDPIITSRLARAALAAGEPRRAIDALEHVVSRYPDHAPAQALLGAARRLDGQGAAAVEPLRAALRLNPFDPAPHCDLAEVSSDAGERSREAQLCRDLGGPH